MLAKTIRLALAVAGATLTIAVAAPLAGATTHIYFGFNNLTASNPSSPNCNGVYSFLSGYACYGLNNNDYNQVEWTSGRSSFRFGFVTCYGCVIQSRLMNGNEQFSTYTVLWSQFPVAHYNYAVCFHVDGGTNTYNYLQCRSLIFP